jgi:hypothetical protein
MEQMPEPGQKVWIHEPDWDTDGTVIECTVKSIRYTNNGADVHIELFEFIYPVKPDGKITEKKYIRNSRSELFSSMEEAIADQAARHAESIRERSENYRKYCEQKRKAWDDHQTFLQQGAYI